MRNAEDVRHKLKFPAIRKEHGRGKRKQVKQKTAQPQNQGKQRIEG
jgi:hypothetical protein